MPGSISRRRLLLAGGAGAGALALGGTALARGGLLSPVLAHGARSAERLDRPGRRRWHQVVIGESREGRPLVIHQNTTPNPRATVVVIAALHGDERGTTPAALACTTAVIPDGISAYVLPTANPDGWARGTRRSATEVDLNRNFPVSWRRNAIGGPGPASEPETRAMIDLVDGLKPTVTIWMHEPLNYVGHVSDSASRYAGAWAYGAGYRTREVFQYGGGETWTGTELGLPAVLVEGESRDETLSDVIAHRRGFDALLTTL